MRINVVSLRQAGIAVVLLHAAVVVVHAVAHHHLNIYMEGWQNVYIFLVIIVLPLLAAVLLLLRSWSGFTLLLVTMVGSALFGGYYHFIATGPDNVASVGAHPWALPFQVTSVTLAIVELIGVLVGVAGLAAVRTHSKRAL